MMFTDIATIKAQAGKGGDGLISFHRTRGNPKGGPDGGDGGKGGSIIVKASHNTNTLTKYRSAKLLRAEDGQAGGGNKRHGKNGEDIILLVPPGTIVRDGEDLIADLVENDQEAIVCAGGSGGFGNTHFKSSIRQAPKMAELGEMGQNKELSLELKLVADVGLVGLPNAGKSTLLSMVSAAKPTIASYAFTTLTPNLGVVDVDERSFLMADIPGLIQGASEGRGLGDEFLRHVERCKVLIHLVDVNSKDIIKDYQTIQGELKNYAVDLSNRPCVIALTKTETKPQAEVDKLVASLAKYLKTKPQAIHAISAVRQMGLFGLMRAANKILQDAQKVEAATAEVITQEIPVIKLSEELGWQVFKEKDKYLLTGEEVERFARRTDFTQADGVRRLREILRKKGVNKELKKLGAEKGDSVVIAGKDLKW